jgi:hypothetical protein
VVFPRRELEELLLAARAVILEKLPSRTKDVLAMTPAARRKFIADRKKQLAEQAAVSPRKGTLSQRGRRKRA